MTADDPVEPMAGPDLARLADATDRLAFGDAMRAAFAKTSPALQAQVPDARPGETDQPRRPRADLSQGSSARGESVPGYGDPGVAFAAFLRDRLGGR